MSDPSLTPAVVVIAAVIERDGRFLITRRLKDTHLAGFWEFPGGKCEPGETHDACLVRELAEELHARVVVGDELIMVEHAYPERTVRLHFHRCRLLDEPTPMLGQEMLWVAREELRTLDFPEADRALIDLLSPPDA
jgi:8-oxo-dGTP diphosphatase/A/G-specific adenine glycosylase